MDDPVSLQELYEVILERHGASPETSYVARLLAKGEDAILRKVAEEATEVILAGKNKDRPAIIHELADLWFHLLVWMSREGITPEEIEQELGRRFGRSGLEEKNARSQAV